MKTTTLTAWAMIILGTYYFTYGEPYIAKHYAYPFEHRATIEAVANTNKIPASLVAGVILAESQPKMTDTDIKAPATNIQLGTWYLGYLMEEFNHNEVLALAAYNAGRGHVESWMEEYQWDKNFNDIDAIPFPETRLYVRNVLKYQERYEELYGQDY